jgi:phosphohistidine phosphatase SixA
MMFLRYILCFLTFASVLAAPAAVLAQAKSGNSKTKTKPLVTTVYLVRHAEKDTTGHPTDPPLSAAGQMRALALRQTLLRRQPTVLFTTDTKRTRATLAPLAEALKLEPQVYDPRRGRDLTDLITKDYAGKTVVIVGHSNNVLSLIDDFGAMLPVEEIKDDEYEYLFTVRLVEGLPPTVDMGGYGAEHKVDKSRASASTMK